MQVNVFDSHLFHCISIELVTCQETMSAHCKTQTSRSQQMSSHRPTHYNSLTASSPVSLGDANTDPSGGAQIEVPVGATTTIAPTTAMTAPTTTTSKPNVISDTNKDAPGDDDTTTKKPDTTDETELVSTGDAKTNLKAGNQTNSTVDFYTAVVTLAGDYSVIVGDRKEKFLSECSQVLDPGACRHRPYMRAHIFTE